MAGSASDEWSLVASKPPLAKIRSAETFVGQLLASGVTALAGDLNFVGAGIAAKIAAILLAVRDGAKTRLMGTLFLFFCHWKFSFGFLIPGYVLRLRIGRAAIVARRREQSQIPLSPRL